MAESTPQTRQSQTTTPDPREGVDTSSSGGKSEKTKQYIRESSYDDELQPDAMRGSEQVVRDAGVEDREEVRRDVYRTEEEKRKRQG